LWHLDGTASEQKSLKKGSKVVKVNRKYKYIGFQMKRNSSKAIFLV